MAIKITTKEQRVSLFSWAGCPVCLVCLLRHYGEPVDKHHHGDCHNSPFPC